MEIKQIENKLCKKEKIVIHSIYNMSYNIGYVHIQYVHSQDDFHLFLDFSFLENNLISDNILSFHQFNRLPVSS